MPEDKASDSTNQKIISDIDAKINEAHNILIALSSDPSVDEMAAAIGLSLYLDRVGKRATAIYSGSTPNALEFLKPEETFETTTDALQDFVIALNKEKADHLRYKLDGDFVKIYITPYRSRISEEDLDYSYGDFNIDLVLALDVANGADLDAALREHGRIMHDAVIVNITTGNPGKLGEIEWSDKLASSVSEMAARLIYGMKDKAEVNEAEATALLTGIVAATNRFLNSKTTSESMKVASRLMESGANQQLISKNITQEIENESLDKEKESDSSKSQPEQLEKTSSKIEKEDQKLDEKDPTVMDISHQEEPKEEELKTEAPKTVPESIDQTETVKTSEETKKPEEDSALLNDLKAAQESLAKTGTETTPEITPEPLKIDSSETPPTTEGLAAVMEATLPTSQDSAIASSDKPEKVIQPSGDMSPTPLSDMGGDNKYGKMLEEALSSVDTPAPVATTPEVADNSGSINNSQNPAAMSAPQVPTNPEINGVPSINYMPMPGDEVLPPPPAPPIEMSSTPLIGANDISSVPTNPAVPITPAAPIASPEPSSLGSQPAMQDQVYGPQSANPGAFKIPGM